MSIRNSDEKLAELRKQAEALLAKKDPFTGEISEIDPLKLIHELQTLQLELELQNEDLRISQQSLLDSLENYEKLYDFAPVGYLTISEKGIIQNVNLTFSGMLSIERAYLISKPLNKLIFQKDQSIFYRHLQELSQSKVRQTCELRLKKRGDIPFYAELDSTILSGKNRNPDQYHIIVIDIEERKASQEELRRFKHIVSCSSDMIALIDRNFVCLEANAAYLKAFKKSKDQVIGHSVSEVSGEVFFRNIIKTYGEKCLNGHHIRRRKWFDFPTSGRRYMDIQYAPYLEHDKEITGFMVTARDITKLRKSEDALKINQLQMEAVLNNIDAFIYIADMASNEILFMNKSMKKTFKKDLIGDICWKSFHKNKTGPCKFCTNEKLIDADGNPLEPYVWEFYNKNLDRWFELHDLAIPWIDGKLVRMEIATDISDRKKIEKRLEDHNIILENSVRERTAQLEDMNAALRVLLDKRDEDKDKIGERIFANHERLISPILDNLKNSLTRKREIDLIEILESELKNIISPFSKQLSDRLINLTPMEIQVADYIKQGKTNKEIAEILNNSVHTISRHRESIREKTGLKNKKINLRSFLLKIG